MFEVNRYLNSGDVIPIISTTDEDDAMCAYFDEVRKLAEYGLLDKRVKYSVTRIVLTCDKHPVMDMTRHYLT